MKLAIAFLLAITVAEAVTVLGDPLAGIILFAIIMAATLVVPALMNNYHNSRLVLSLALVPLVRIVSLAMPVADLPQIWWFPVMYLPLFLAAILLTFILSLRLKEIGFNFRAFRLNLLIAASGVVLGITEYLILRPEPMVAELTWQAAFVPALILLLTTGLVEEMIFRGVMQKTAVEMFGRWGIVYVSYIFAILHLGFLSVLDVVFVLAASLYFGWVVHKTGSLFGVVVAHGITNIVLFIIAPHLLG